MTDRPSVRAPWPHRPKSDISRPLRIALAESWSERRHDHPESAYDLLSVAVICVVADLEAQSVEEWERIRAELERARS